MEIIRTTLERLEVAEPTSFGNLTLFPLLGGAERRPEYATLDEALEQGWLEVREVSAAGSVPELTLANRGDRAVFLMDGEELVGAKQNRVLNLTILAPAGKTLVVPVSCVERGRWAARSRGMSSSRDTLYAGARMSKLASVTRAYAAHGVPRSDQAALWEAISNKALELHVESPTDAMADIFSGHQHRVTDYEHAFGAVEHQCGALFAIGPRLVGFELFEHPDVLRRMLCKIVRSYALDAIGGPESEAVPTAEAARALLDEVAAARAERFPAVGLGEDVRLAGARVTAAALVADDRVVHLCAFRTEDGGEGGSSPFRSGRIASASRRRPRFA